MNMLIFLEELINQVLKHHTLITAKDLQHELGSRYKLWLENILRASSVVNHFPYIFSLVRKYFFGNEFFVNLSHFPKKYILHHERHEEVATRACRIDRFCLYITIGHLLCHPLVWKAFALKYAIIIKQYKGISTLHVGYI